MVINRVQVAGRHHDSAARCDALSDARCVCAKSADCVRGGRGGVHSQPQPRTGAAVAAPPAAARKPLLIWLLCRKSFIPHSRRCFRSCAPLTATLCLAAPQGDKLDALLVDAGSNDQSLGMSCPPAAFLEPRFLARRNPLLPRECRPPLTGTHNTPRPLVGRPPESAETPRSWVLSGPAPGVGLAGGCVLGARAAGRAGCERRGALQRCLRRGGRGHEGGAPRARARARHEMHVCVRQRLHPALGS